MKFYRSVSMFCIIFFTGSIANADSIQGTKDTDLQLGTENIVQLFKQVALVDVPLVDGGPDRKEKPCLLAEFIWYSIASEHHTSGYCQSNDCTALGVTSSSCD